MEKSRAIPRPTTPSPVSGRAPVRSSVQSVTETAAAVGDVVSGKYLIEGSLGEGGVGRVMMARNIELDERVALKFLKPEMLSQPEIVGRFMREAKAACSIKSEYVASVYDVGQTEGGAPYLVMDYLDGKDLGAVIHERGPLSVRESSEFLLQACEGIAVAHSLGIVHRDIKPENLFVTTRAGMSVIKVLDFGISKTALTGSVFGSEIPLLKTVNLMGTPLYMSPEQVRCSDAIDARSDIWALGMVLYEVLTGTLPFPTTSLTELCAAILEQPLQSLAQHRNDLPDAFVAVVEKCLEKDPAKRYQNVSELAIALMPFAPRRARICAERATQALAAKGLAEARRFDSTMPPPDLSRSSQNPLYISSTIPRLGSLPNIPLGETSSLAAAAVATTTTPPSNRKKLGAVLAVCALVVAVVAIVIVKSTASGPAPITATAPPAQTALPTATTAEKTADPKPTEVAAKATTTATGSTTAPIAATPRAVAAPAYAWPPPAAKPKEPKPAKTDTKKSADEPDLGY